MAQKARSAQLTVTAWDYCESLVNSGIYSTIDDAVSDLIMQVRRGIGVVPPSTPQYSQVLPSIAPQTPSTSPIEALKNMSFD